MPEWSQLKRLAAEEADSAGPEIVEAGMFEFDELDKVEEEMERAEMEKALETAASGQNAETSAGSPFEWPVRWRREWRQDVTSFNMLEDIWGLRFGGDEADNTWQGSVKDSGTKAMMNLIKEELELEAEAERRMRHARQRIKGIEGAKITIPIPEHWPGKQQSKSSGANGREEEEWFCELLVNAIAAIYKLLLSFPESTMAAIKGAWTLGPHIAGIERLLNLIVPGQFNLQAAGHCQRLLALLAGPDRSLYALISGMMEERVPLSKARAMFPQTQIVLKDIEEEAMKLAGCLLEPSQAIQEAIDKAHEDLSGANSHMTPEYASSLTKAHFPLMHHSRFEGDTIICRTNPESISRLLYDLRAGFQAEDFQTRYKELRSKARMGGGAHAEMVFWSFQVQRSVLPRYGFPANAAGVMSMRRESGLHADGAGPPMGCRGDKVVAKLRRDIHMCLDMDVQKHARLPLFHTVGDSHSKFGWPEQCIQHWQGPLLCYNVDRVDLQTLDPAIREGDAVCFCFGEIDCRCHVHKHVTEDKTYKEVIDGIISRYFNHLESQLRLLPAGVRMFVYNVPPPVRRCDTEENAAFPYLGTDEERQSYVLYFNKQLKKSCKRTSIRYFDVYDQYVDEEGFLSKEFSDGNVHIADGSWIEEVIQQLNLKPFRPSQINFGS